MKKVFIGVDKFGNYLPNTSAYQKVDSDKLIQKFGYTKNECQLLNIKVPSL